MTAPQPKFFCPICRMERTGRMVDHIATHKIEPLAWADSGVYVGRLTGRATTTDQHFLRFTDYPDLKGLQPSTD